MHESMSHDAMVCMLEAECQSHVGTLGGCKRSLNNLKLRSFTEIQLEYWRAALAAYKIGTGFFTKLIVEALEGCYCSLPIGCGSFNDHPVGAFGGC